MPSHLLTARRLWLAVLSSILFLSFAIYLVAAKSNHVLWLIFPPPASAGVPFEESTEPRMVVEGEEWHLDSVRFVLPAGAFDKPKTSRFFGGCATFTGAHRRVVVSLPRQLGPEERRLAAGA